MNVNDIIKNQAIMDPDDYRAERVEELKEEHKTLMEAVPAMIEGAMVERIEDHSGFNRLIEALMAFRRGNPAKLQQWITNSIDESATANAWIDLIQEEVEARAAQESNDAFHAKMDRMGC